MENKTKLVLIGMLEKSLTRKPRQTKAPVCCSFQVNIYPRSQLDSSLLSNNSVSKGTKLVSVSIVRIIIVKKAKPKCQKQMPKNKYKKGQIKLFNIVHDKLNQHL